MNSKDAPAANTEQNSPSVLFARLLWFVLGPAILLLLSGKIISDGPAWFSRIDAWFALAVVGAALGRWYEQSSGHGTDCGGNPSTKQDCYRYIGWLTGAAIALWVVSHVLGSYVGS